MTLLLFAGVGIALSSCFIHAVLGLGRRIDWLHLCFALMMAALSGYFIAEHQLYTVDSVGQGVRIARLELPFILIYFGLLGWFIPRYTGLRIPRGVGAAYGVILVGFLIYDVIAPYGMYYAELPRLETHPFWGGEPVRALVGPLGPVPIAFYLLAAALHVTGIVGGIHLARQGERLRGAVMATAMALPLITLLFDLVEEMLHGGGPYLAEFGVVALSLTMSVQLAVDYRGKELALQRANDVLAASAARASLLAEAAQALAQPGGLERALDQLARLCSSRLTDWCVIDLYQPGGSMRIGAPSAEAEAPLLSALVAGSVCVVPLRSGARTLGVMWWVSTQRERFSEADRALAAALADRAALVVVNAQLAEAEAISLQRLARMALAVRDMANTPLQTLEFCIALIEHGEPPGEAIGRMRRALWRLQQLESTLAPYAAQIRWSERDASFDPVTLLERERSPRIPS